MELKDYMLKLFYPQSIGIVEASSRRLWQIIGIKERNFQGELYLVSKNEPEIQGIKCYQDISELPDNIDLVIIAVNRTQLLELIKKCVEKKVRVLHIFSAGGAEFDTYGKDLEKDILEVLKNSGTRAIGLNCMGVYSTGGRIAYSPYFAKEPVGNVSFVSQSGDLTTRFVNTSNEHGVNFSQVASIGNSIDLRISHFLEYFSQDTNTEIIGAYFEGFSQFDTLEGRNLMRILKNNKKPALILKGGVSEQGKRSVNSHTGTIASNNHFWDAMFAQTGAIKIDSYEELVDSAIAFYHCKNLLPTINSVLLIIWSGGFGVLGVDQIIRLGIDVPEITSPVKEKMKSMISVGSVSNPLDLPWIGRREKFPEICKLAINEPYIGGVILETIAPLEFDDWHTIYFNNILKIAHYSKEAGKPFLLSLPYSNIVPREQEKDNFVKNNIPVFPSVERAAKAFFNLYLYNKKRVLF